MSVMINLNTNARILTIVTFLCVLETTTNNNKLSMLVRREFLYICCRPAAIILTFKSARFCRVKLKEPIFFHDAISLFMKERGGGQKRDSTYTG